MQPHIHLKPNPDYARVITCGSPERAKLFAGMMEGAKPVAQNREYHSYLGRGPGGVPVLILSHGVGSAGAMIAFQEAANAGAQVMVRIGTAGGLYDDVKIGDIVLAQAAVRQEGTSTRMLPVEFPAVADLDLLTALKTRLDTHQWKGRTGTVVSSDLFYPGLLDNQLELYARAGAVAVEMELSALYVFGQLRGVKTAGMAVLDGNPLKWREGHYDPDPARLQKSIELCFRAAVEAVAAIAI